MSDGEKGEFLIVTGMSGAGRATVANALEDLGWYVVDNLPPQILRPLLDLTGMGGDSLPKVAAVVDVRGRNLFDDFPGVARVLRTRGSIRVLFLDASDDVLVRRFEAVRRPHPLQGDATKVSDIFSEAGEARHRVTLLSFGFKYGLPTDVDVVADMRFLPNPYWNEDLRGLTGQDETVREYVLSRDGAEEFLDAYAKALVPVLEGYQRENKSHSTIAIGCTGGKHRSVAMSEELARRLTGIPGVAVNVRHRDLGRE